MGKLAQTLRTAVATTAMIGCGGAVASIDFGAEGDQVIQLVAEAHDKRPDLRLPTNGYDFVAAANRWQSGGCSITRWLPYHEP